MEQSTSWLGNLLRNDILRRGLLDMLDDDAPSPPGKISYLIATQGHVVPVAKLIVLLPF